MPKVTGKDFLTVTAEAAEARKNRPDATAAETLRVAPQGRRAPAERSPRGAWEPALERNRLVPTLCVGTWRFAGRAWAMTTRTSSSCGGTW